MGMFDYALQRARCLAGQVTGLGAVQRSAAEQGSMEAHCRYLVLYDMPACPYCCMVKRCINRLGLNIPVRDTVIDDDAYQALIEATGSSQPNVSKHLTTLLAHRLVKREKRGNSAY